MKLFYLLPLALLVAGCSSAPDMDSLRDDSEPLVEQLVQELDTEGVTHRMDRYTLDEHPSDLSYTGSCKITEFTSTTAEDGSVQVDSTMYYRYVVINFHGKDYDKYTVNLYEDKE
ncbi:MAG: hypothetical protein IJP49_03640 [Bacteroidales bacterium]|nr:hypothetical protein [Bacteroidales bacterium]